MIRVVIPVFAIFSGFSAQVCAADYELELLENAKLNMAVRLQDEFPEKITENLADSGLANDDIDILISRSIEAMANCFVQALSEVDSPASRWLIMELAENPTDDGTPSKLANQFKNEEELQAFGYLVDGIHKICLIEIDQRFGTSLSR